MLDGTSIGAIVAVVALMLSLESKGLKFSSELHVK